MKDKNEIPSGKLKRGAIAGLAAARSGFKKLGSLSKRPFISPGLRDIHDNENDEEIAQIIFDALSRMKGTALKAAQMASMEAELLPEIYRKKLYRAASQVPPINRALVRKIIKTNLGDYPENIFTHFETTAFAAASLGQVHRAQLKDGRDLAVKVQYPGIDRCVKSDLDLLKIILKPTKYSSIFRHCINEIESKIDEELDYNIEAANTKLFSKSLDHCKYVIPEVNNNLTAKNVISSTLVAGLHLDEWLETNPSKEEKNRYGQLLADLFNFTSNGLKIIHADPNPGNYLFREDGRLGVIDFGCVKRLDDDFINAVELLNEIGSGDNRNELKKIYETMGIYFNKDFENKDFKAFIDLWIEWITRPARGKYFDFLENSGYFMEGMGYLKKFYGYIDHFDGAFTYYGRTLYGLYRILQKLGARVRMRYS